jgi:Flp pilus assembly pilin Flp
MSSVLSAPIVTRPPRVTPARVTPTRVNPFRREAVAFWRADDGQDLLEYGLLAAFIGITCLAVWASIEGHLRTAYLGYDSGVQGLWQPPNPGGGS